MRRAFKLDGLFKFLGIFLPLVFFSATAPASDVSLTWNASTNSDIAGYIVYYGQASGVYNGLINAGTNLTAVATGLSADVTNYFAVLAYDTNGDDSEFSNEITNVVPLAPTILTEPQTQSVIATSAASFSSVVAGNGALFYQWYFGTAAIAGGTNSTVAWARVAAGNAGFYYFVVSNSAGAVTSSVATMTVLPSNTIATVAGVYNGLFYQTNANGTSDVTQATAGSLDNCVVASNGAYSAKICLDGGSYSLAGSFSVSGTAGATIPLTNSGLSDVAVVLQLDLFNGTRQITGSVSGVAAGIAWTSPLLGNLTTNGYPQLASVDLLLSPVWPTNSPTSNGVAIGLIGNSLIFVTGNLGDTVAISQTAPISTDGDVPIYVNLYTNGGLLEGWINVAGGVATGTLTWIRPGGVLMPPGFSQGFDTLEEVTGETSTAKNFARVQYVHADTGTKVAITPRAGDCLVAICQVESSNVNMTISDGVNTWVKQQTSVNPTGSPVTLSLFTALNVAGAAATVTVDGSSYFDGLTVIEYSGVTAVDTSLQSSTNAKTMTIPLTTTSMDMFVAAWANQAYNSMTNETLTPGSLTGTLVESKTATNSGYGSSWEWLNASAGFIPGVYTNTYAGNNYDSTVVAVALK